MERSLEYCRLIVVKPCCLDSHRETVVGMIKQLLHILNEVGAPDLAPAFPEIVVLAEKLVRCEAESVQMAQLLLAAECRNIPSCLKQKQQ